MDFEAALECIKGERGKHFDPFCVDAFTMAWDAVRAVRTFDSGQRLAALVRGTEPWARVPEMPREAV